MGLVIVGVTVTIVPLVASFTLDAVLFLAPVLNPIACIFVANNDTRVSFVLIVTHSFKVKSNAQSLCAQESCFHTKRT
jgi:hypothetical protein